MENSLDAEAARLAESGRGVQTIFVSFVLIAFTVAGTAIGLSDETILTDAVTSSKGVDLSLPVSGLFAMLPAVLAVLAAAASLRFAAYFADIDRWHNKAHTPRQAPQSAKPMGTDEGAAGGGPATGTPDGSFERMTSDLRGLGLYALLGQDRSCKVGAIDILFLLLVWAGTFALPPLVQLLIQISLVRYQSYALTTWHALLLGFAIVTVSLLWLGRLRRLHEMRLTEGTSHTGVLCFLSFLSVVYLIAIVALIPMSFPPSRGDSLGLVSSGNLLDRVLCPKIHWGCRYLDLNHRVLVNQDVSTVLSQLIDGDSNLLADAKRRALGIDLRGRSLRFANFDSSVMPGADLMNSDLTGANFTNAVLFRAVLDSSHMEGTNFISANLSRARINLASIKHSFFNNADLSGADIAVTHIFNNSDFYDANLSGAIGRWSSVENAHMDGIVLRNADFSSATLLHSDLSGAELSGASLHGAFLCALNLYAPPLSGTLDLRGARIEATDLTSLDFRSVHSEGALVRDGGILDRSKNGDTLQDLSVAYTEPAASPDGTTVNCTKEFSPGDSIQLPAGISSWPEMMCENSDLAIGLLRNYGLLLETKSVRATDAVKNALKFLKARPDYECKPKYDPNVANQLDAVTAALPKD